MGPISPLHQSHHHDTEVLRAQLPLLTPAGDPLRRLLASSLPAFMFSKVFAAIGSSRAETHLPSSTHLKSGNLTKLCMWSVERDR